jgi:hypothetical protein
MCHSVLDVEKPQRPERISPNKESSPEDPPVTKERVRAIPDLDLIPIRK